jgi:hypothetical protein
VSDADPQTGWFGGDLPRTEDESRFLSRLRNRVLAWDSAVVDSSDSWCIAKLVPLVVGIEHARLSTEGALTCIQVGYWPPASGAIRLEGEWGDSHLLDNGGGGGDLRVQGIAADPEFFADLASDWIESQLRRPIERLEWFRGERVAASRIRLADTGQVLARRGSRLQTRRPPDRTTRLD